MPQNRAMLNAWARVSALFEAQADEKKVDGIADRVAGEQLSEAGNDVMKACSLIRDRVTHLILKHPKGLGRMLHTTEQSLREVAKLTHQPLAPASFRIHL